MMIAATRARLSSSGVEGRTTCATERWLRGGAARHNLGAPAKHEGHDFQPFRKADDGSRTRDLRLGKPTLYQLSYVRLSCIPRHLPAWPRSVGPQPGRYHPRLARAAPRRCPAGPVVALDRLDRDARAATRARQVGRLTTNCSGCGRRVLGIADHDLYAASDESNDQVCTNPGDSLLGAARTLASSPMFARSRSEKDPSADCIPMKPAHVPSQAEIVPLPPMMLFFTWNVRYGAP